MKYYRLKNPITNKYYCKSADQSEECTLEQAIAYDEDTVNKILHDANVVCGIFMNYMNKKNNKDSSPIKFPGYELEEVNPADMPLPKEFDSKINQYAESYNLSYTEAKSEMVEMLIKFWSAWATFNPFTGEPYPTEKNPFTD